MQWQERVQRARAEWMLLTFYEKFEQIIILILTGLIAIVIVFAVWNLTLKIFHGVIAPQSFDPTEYSVFQAVFGAIFTVIIALEFKRSLLVVAQRQESIVQVRTVVLIALLAIVRKVMILDLASTEALQLSRLPRQSWRLALSIGWFATKIAASSPISHRNTVSRSDNRLPRVRSSAHASVACPLHSRLSSSLFGAIFFPVCQKKFPVSIAGNSFREATFLKGFVQAARDVSTEIPCIFPRIREFGCREGRSGLSDNARNGNRGALRSTRLLDRGLKLMRQRLDDARAKANMWGLVARFLGP